MEESAKKKWKCAPSTHAVLLFFLLHPPPSFGLQIESGRNKERKERWETFLKTFPNNLTLFQLLLIVSEKGDESWTVSQWHPLPVPMSTRERRGASDGKKGMKEKKRREWWGWEQEEEVLAPQPVLWEDRESLLCSVSPDCRKNQSQDPCSLTAAHSSPWTMTTICLFAFLPLPPVFDCFLPFSPQENVWPF